MEDENGVRQKLNLTLILVGIFALAFFIRAFFAYDLSLGDYLVSGGSDSYYYAWINEYIASTGNHLVRDPMLNFPVGMNNPRPPIFAWSVTLTGILVGYFQGSVELGIWQSFLTSTALWGALTIFPTYFLAKEIFGRRAGLVAALFLALLPAHIQRTPLSNGDHDALVLFFVVAAFFFYIKALAELKERTWIANWLRPREIYDGFKGLLLENRKTILYAIMSGTCLATIALTWQGWAYAPIIVIAYFLVQLVVHKLRNQDPLGILMVFGVALGVAVLLAAPYYYSTGFVRTWFDVPLLLYAMALGLGALFTVFHRLPWTLVIPPIIIGFGGGLAIAAVYSPTIAATLSSGFGYFVPDKVFETIAEAQPPEFSLAMTSFGLVTSWLSLGGIVLMGLQFVRRPRPDYLFALAWSVAAIFMAMSAVRFLFNASPAFAITSAWVAVLIVERLALTEVRKAVATTGGSRLAALRKGVKVRHIAGAFFVAVLLIIPNAWSAIDAGVPFEKKRELDIEVYRVTPEFLRPQGYQEGIDLFYFGAFGYSLPLRTRYYPTAWAWFSEQDSDVFPLTARPAFLSWWDYGFEAIQEGRHPTVADNFQNGYEYAGHFLLSQSENEALAVLNVRILLGDVIAGTGHFAPDVVDVLGSRGLDLDQIRDVLLRPTVYVPLIRSEPDRFGEWDARISARNARVIYLKTYFTEELDLDGQAALYEDLVRATGNSVDYFAVDSRLVPFSGTNTGIFYAMAKLTDHRTAELPDLRSIPLEFYRLIADTDRGEFDLDKLPPTARVANIRIEYLEPFYNSMFYRIFFGIRGSDIGLEDEGLPGISGALASENPIHGWMLKHFKLVYRTAYFNPFPSDQVAEHREAWRAVNYFDALELQELIQAGVMEGTVDLSAAGNLQQGVVFLKYYDGTVVRGRVRSESGAPIQGVRVTASDELGVPHDFTSTDAEGFYKLTVPFGQALVVASVGVVDNRTQVGTQVLAERILDIGEERSGAGSGGVSGPGSFNNVLEEDFTVTTSTVKGIAFRDLNGNSARDAGEEGVANLRVELRGLPGNVIASTTSGVGGVYELSELLPGDFTIQVLRDGTELVDTSVSLSLGLVQEQDLPLRVSRVSGTVTNEFGEPAAGARLEVFEFATGILQETFTGPDGNYTLEGLLRGNYTLEATLGGRGSLPTNVRVVQARNATVDLTIRPLGAVHGRTLINFRPTPSVTVNLHSSRVERTISFTSDSSGRFDLNLPEGKYSAYALHFKDGRAYAFLGSLTVREGLDLQWQINLLGAVRVEGVVATAAGEPAAGALVTFESNTAPFTLTTGAAGTFLARLPPGSYRLWSIFEAQQHTSTLTLTQSTSMDIQLTRATPTVGRVYRDFNGNGSWDPGEGMGAVRVDFVDTGGNRLAALTDRDGDYQIPLLNLREYTLTIEEEGFHRVSLGPLNPSELGEVGEIALVPITQTVQGRLLSQASIDFGGISVLFQAIRDGAETLEVTADSAGLFTAALVPGLYEVVVDTTLVEGVRLQNLEPQTLRVAVGKPVSGLQLEIVKRVNVEGFLTVEGSPFTGNLSFSGPETVTVAVLGSFAQFLQPGAYTLYGLSEFGAQRYVLLEHLTIASPTNISAPATNITSLRLAAVLSGVLSVDGTSVDRALLLEFQREDGAILSTSTGQSGEYEIALDAGSYDLSIDWHGVDRLDGDRRFVRYTLDQEVTLISGEDLDLALSAVRTLDNATVTGSVLLSGQPASAKIILEAANETAISASFNVPGSYDLTLAPGSYNVYAIREIGSWVSLSSLTVLPEVENKFDVVLEKGYLVAGVADLKDVVNTEVTLTFRGVASVSFASDESGLFGVHLPRGEYIVDATAQKLERGIEVQYTDATTLDLQGDTLLNLLLERVDLPEVELAWDESERATILPGESVVYTITVRNIGNVEDEYVFEGSPGDWDFKFEPSSIRLPFGHSNETTTRVTITTTADALVDHPSIFIEASSASRVGVTDLITVELDIVHLRDVDLRLSPQPPALSPEALEYQVQIVNTGNGRDDFSLELLNPGTLITQGWRPRLVLGEQIRNTTLENIMVTAGSSSSVTLRLEAVGPVDTSQAVLEVRSQTDTKVRATLSVQLSFATLSIPVDGVDVTGRNIQLTPPEFPFLVYGLIAAVGAIAAILFIRRRRSRGRRR